MKQKALQTAHRWGTCKPPSRASSQAGYVGSLCSSHPPLRSQRITNKEPQVRGSRGSGKPAQVSVLEAVPADRLALVPFPLGRSGDQVLGWSDRSILICGMLADLVSSA